MPSKNKLYGKCPSCGRLVPVFPGINGAHAICDECYCIFGLPDGWEDPRNRKAKIATWATVLVMTLLSLAGYFLLGA
jgi:uncharacterized paraquat-inducible protein A